MNEHTEHAPLELQITFRQIEPTEALKSHAQKKTGKLLTHLHNAGNQPRMILGTDNLIQYSELEVFDGHERYFARSEAKNLYESINDVVAKVTHQLDEAHRKTRDTRRQEQAKTKKALLI